MFENRLPVVAEVINFPIAGCQGASKARTLTKLGFATDCTAMIRLYDKAMGHGPMGQNQVELGHMLGETIDF